MAAALLTPTRLSPTFPGAVDSHAHVFEPGLPLAAGRRYAPDYAARLPDYLAMLDSLGLSHGVLVQPSFLGTDNSYLCAALAAAPQRLRGVAVVGALDAPLLPGLAAQGVVGLRLNLLGAPLPDLVEWRPVLEEAARLALHIEVQVESGRLRAFAEPLLQLPLHALVVDHFGLPDPAQMLVGGRGDLGLGWLLRAATKDSTRRIWMKLSGAYRISSSGPAVARAMMPGLRTELGLDRCLFGTDWPHTRYESSTRAAEALALLQECLPDAAAQRAVLWDAPAALFRFHAAQSALA